LQTNLLLGRLDDVFDEDLSHAPITCVDGRHEWLARSVGSCNTQVGRVIAADVVALAYMVIGLAAYVVAHRRA